MRRGRCSTPPSTASFTDDDWDHSRGGIHVVALDGGSVIGHGAVVQRRLTTAGRAHRVGYVEGLGVHPEWQRPASAAA